MLHLILILPISYFYQGSEPLFDPKEYHRRQIVLRELGEEGQEKFPKVEATAKRISEINPEVKVEPIPENLRQTSVEKLLKGVDRVVDGMHFM